MKTVASTLFAIVGLAVQQAHPQVFWINEFHYDDAGADIGEFVEVAVPTSFINLVTLRVTLYNGADGATYGSSHLLSTFTAGGTSGDYTFYSKTIAGIQNGAPDGLALDQSGTVLQFISYEGQITATAGPANGQTSTDIGVLETDPGTAEGSSLGLTGTGDDYADFAWTTFAAAATPGAVNGGQTIVPEPHEYALACGVGLLAFAGWRRRKLKRV